MHAAVAVMDQPVLLHRPSPVQGLLQCVQNEDLKEEFEKYLGQIELSELPTFSDCVEALNAGQVDAVTTDDVILAGFAAEDQYRGKLKVIGKGFSDELYGIGIKKGDTAMVDKVTAALKQYIDDGSWEKSLNSTVRPSGYSIPDPPTPGTA